MLSLVLFGPPTTCTSSDILIYLFAIPYLYAVFMERTGSLQVDAASLCNMNSYYDTASRVRNLAINDKLTYSLLLCQQHRPAGLGSFDAQSLSLLPIFLRLTFPIALAGSRSLPAVWLIPYRMGFPPIKCFTLSWTH